VRPGRWAIYSLLALLGIWMVLQGMALTPEQVAEKRLLAEMNVEAGLIATTEMRQRPQVIDLGDGLLVERIQMGSGPVPQPDDLVVIHYQGWHLDGRLFDSSYRLGEAVTIPLARTIPAWREVLSQMPSGSHLRLLAPPEKAWGVAGAGVVGPLETLLFEIELIDTLPPEPAPSAVPAWQQPVPGLS
jgi:FKBP-type peptidyl-prolyl cis-trans isomerase FkpA